MAVDAYKLLKNKRFDPCPAVRLEFPGFSLSASHLHEVVPDGLFHLGAAAGFALGLAAQSPCPGRIVWIQQDMAALEGGQPYGLGTVSFAIAPSRLLLVRTPSAKDTLWAMEESLRTAGVAAVIGELAGAGDAADLTATRRLNLVLQERQALGLLLRQQSLRGTSACATRWRARAAPGGGDAFGGIGRTAFALTLEKNRHGPCGHFLLEWDQDARSFRAALPVAMVAPSFNRPHRAA
jgi:protein ImuA